jgi:thiamine-monophosphate kinase
MTPPLTTVGQIGELGLIARLRAICAEGRGPGDAVLLGIGDDAAAFRVEPGRAVLATCDIQIEDVHFRSGGLSPYQLGRRSIAVNQSDIASMGGEPTLALVSLALPPRLPVESFDALFRGMRDQMAEFSAAIVGGNLARSETLVIDIFLLGEADPGLVLTRAGARPGDVVYVTGELGASAAGLALLSRSDPSPPDRLARLAEAHREPKPRVREGVAIARAGLASAMIDISDGLAADLHHLCEASRVGAELQQADVPCAEGIETVASMCGTDPWHYVLFGGEDYELLFTVGAAAAERVPDLAKQLGTPLHRIGTILPPERGLQLVAPDGTPAPLPATGWDHFRPSPPPERTDR